MKSKILRILYDALNTPTIDNNPFRSKKFQVRFNSFLNNYINEAQRDDAHEHLEVLCETCMKTAFELGFFTAVKLLRKS